MNIDQEIVESSLSDLALLPKEESPIESFENLVQDDLKLFLIAFHEMKDPEAKIRLAIEFMKGRLTSFISPKFREFWEVRKLCLPFFKEGLASKIRSELWSQYVDLAVEARRIKQILDEKSIFAYEQIDLALQSLIENLEDIDSALIQIPPIEIPPEAKTLSGKKEIYISTQKKLHLFNTLATKVNALRKEVMKTDMRVRNKNKLFEKLSACGDRIFPNRKELIKIISETFLEDVTQFCSQFFMTAQSPSFSLYPLREEVKGLQSIAKILTLNTYSFTETRLKLSACWDALKEKEKEKKKEISEKKAEFQQNFEAASLKVEEFELFCQKQISFHELEIKYGALIQALKEVEMDRAEVRILREKIDFARKPHDDKKRESFLEAQEKEKEKENNRLQKVKEAGLSLQTILDTADTLSFESLTAEKNKWEELYKTTLFSKAEKAFLDRLLKQLKDKLLDAKGRSLFSFSSDKRNFYSALKQLLEEKKQRKQEVKLQLEGYRKVLGGSGLDIEKAIYYRELMDLEKQSLEKINGAIAEIEAKMNEMNG